jgi:hypothetical protein
MLIKHLAKIQHEIDEIVYDLYEISPEDRILIEKELKRMDCFLAVLLFSWI